jgi:preprotein translocase subunit SecF
VAASIALWLRIKREDLIRSNKREIDPNDPNAGAMV